MINSFFYCASSTVILLCKEYPDILNLTFNLKAIEDIHGDGVDLQLTGALLLNLIQD